MVSQKISGEDLKNLIATKVYEAESVSSAANSDFVKILSRLNRSQVQELMTDHHYQAGEIIFCEGDEGDALYLIWAGRVAVVKGPVSNPDEVFVRQPGEVVGEMAILENKPRWASLIALEDVRVLRIERAGFQTLLQSQPEISLSLLAAMSARLRTAHDLSKPVIKKDQQLIRKLSSLIDENEQLLELQRVRQETSDLIVHDLRSPLNNMISVLNMMELVLPEDVLTANRELLDIARLAHSRMQDLVDSLLDVSKLETGDVALNVISVDLTQLVDEVIALASFTIDQQKRNFQKNYDPDLPQVKIDEDRIRRVLTNLVDNAVKFTPKDGVVKVEVKDLNDHISVSITDSGPGIPPSDWERVFERFAQVERSGMRRTRGFGLGLAFCRLAVEAHGGKIWIEAPENDKGSCFVFTLPKTKH